MTEEEREEFDCDVKKIEWSQYLENYARGL
jgi:hypothetical protein